MTSMQEQNEIFSTSSPLTTCAKDLDASKIRFRGVFLRNFNIFIEVRLDIRSSFLISKSSLLMCHVWDSLEVIIFNISLNVWKKAQFIFFLSTLLRVYFVLSF